MTLPETLPFIAILLATIHSGLCRDLLPERWLENIPTADGSTQACLVFKTVPGVGYRVESSPDLIQWTTENELYGLGHEFVTPMREFIPAPPPLPGDPPAAPVTFPTTNVSLWLNPSNAAAGGTVVSWRSLDDHGPRVWGITGNLDPNWSQVPLYAQSFGEFAYFITHPGTPIAPPANPLFLGPLDTAMIADLEQNLAAMNLQVADSAAQARNAPPPAPPNPDDRHFWRIHCDWGLDTDHDGSPDWAEFEIAARGTGQLVPEVQGNAFDADTNSDGIPDGAQLDTDGDGTPDSDDPDVSDDTFFFVRGSMPRYALFPISGVDHNLGSIPGALQINARGTVLYENGTWSAGSWTPLIGPPSEDGDEPQRPHARAINDHDTILGSGWFSVYGDPAYTFQPAACFWEAPDAEPNLVSSGENSGIRFAQTTLSLTYALLTPGPALSNDRHFSGISNYWDPVSERLESDGFHVWKLPDANLTSSSEVSGDASLEYNLSADFRWGENLVTEGNSSAYHYFIEGPGNIPELDFFPMNVIQAPQAIIAMPYFITDSPQALVNGTWKPAKHYAHAFDMSDDGTAIAYNFDGMVAPILAAGTWQGIERTAPDVPNEWKNSEVTLLDTAANGWTLLQGEETNASTGWIPKYTHAVMMPMRAKGQFTNHEGAVVREAAGVDDMSIRSTKPGTTVSDRIWIMVPKGGADKTVTFQSPANSTNQLKLSAVGIDMGEPDGSVTLSTPESLVTIKAGTAVTGTDIPVQMRLGTVNSLSKPLGLKVMKSRRIKVAVHLVTSKVKNADPTKPDKLDPPKFQPTQGQLEDYLDDIYGPQINARFDVNLTGPGNSNGISQHWEMSRDSIQNTTKFFRGTSIWTLWEKVSARRNKLSTTHCTTTQQV